MSIIEDPQVKESSTSEPSVFLGENSPSKCPCPSSIKGAGESSILTCQRLFRIAYNGGGYPDSFSRAMFVEFAKNGFDHELVPILVRRLCQSIDSIPKFHDGFGVRGVSKCMGCSMNKGGFAWLTMSYDIIHPEVNLALLQQHATDPGTCRAPLILVVDEELSEAEKAWRELIKSGALDEEDEGWREAMG